MLPKSTTTQGRRSPDAYVCWDRLCREQPSLRLHSAPWISTGIIHGIKREGITSVRAITEELNRQGISAPRGRRVAPHCGVPATPGGTQKNDSGGFPGRDG